MEPVSLEEQAFKRKERLRALKRGKDGGEENDETTNEDSQKNPQENAEKVALPKPKFRSYLPENEQLRENALPLAEPGNIVQDVQEQLAAAKDRVVIDELDIANLAPRKPDWDLKRDVAKRLEKLERRTQKAIAELIRERLKERQQQEDLASLVNQGTSI